jgi:aminocarboxymuconate-semialdehyde decarboxylase
VVGTDYPFPLGEDIPGELVRSLKLEKEIEDKLMYKNAINWLWG